LSGGSVIVPCRDGNLRELPLEERGEPPVPLAWRDRNAGAQAAGHAVLAGRRLFASDGLRKIQRWERGPGDAALWRKIPEGTLEVPGRIATPLLPVPAGGADPYLCVGDENGTLYLLSTTTLAPVRHWRLGGKITAGPFLRGDRIGCVIDDRRLVWLDPAADGPLWEYQSESQIIGEPQQQDNLILVTEAAGAFTWLDAATGAVRGRSKPRLRVAPTTAAVFLAAGRALAPLSDGTLLLLSMPKPREQ
jgi:outer membrane protein assembly factor BamB